MKILKQPYNLFSWAGLLFLILSFLPIKQTIDVHIHDTYYVIGFDHAYIIASAISFLYWLLYWLSAKLIILSPLLTLLHIIATLLPLFLLLLLLPTGAIKFKFIDLSLWRDRYLMSSLIADFLIRVFVAGQIIVIINLVTGFIKKIYRS